MLGFLYSILEQILDMFESLFEDNFQNSELLEILILQNKIEFYLSENQGRHTVNKK
jgi:hypothetical protein